jgi:N-acetylglucosamine kinase-like BadF-type ATPase
MPVTRFVGYDKSSLIEMMTIRDDDPQHEDETLALYLAVDLGGTKTEYVLADETNELARVRGGTIKRMRTDAATAEQNFDAAIREIEAKSGCSVRDVTRSCVGAAGVTVPLVTDWIKKIFAEHVGGSLILLGDVEIALDGAFFGGPGVLVMAGTGSNVAGRSAAGKLTTAGGWGPALADQGSGARIGQQALRDAALAYDEERETRLLQAILQAWNLKNFDELVAYANQIPSPDLTRLAPVVKACADAGDTVAQGVLRREAEELAHLARIVIDRLRREDPRSGWLPDLAFTGSILEHVPAIRDGIVEILRQELPDLKVVPGMVDPPSGALWRARHG